MNDVQRVAPGHYEVGNFTIKRAAPRAGIRAGKITRWYVYVNFTDSPVANFGTFTAALSWLEDQEV